MSGRRQGRARPPLILIADDDPGARLLQSTALESAAFEVLTAADGASALELFDTHKPDCLVLDVVMPGIDGYELCTRIRQLPNGRLVPILIQTGLDDFSSIGKAYAAGATDFAHKGIAPLLLVERVRFLLRSSQTQIDLLDSEARLAEAQRIARIGHWELDLAARTIAVSTVALDLLGLDRKDVAALDALYELVHPEDRAGLKEAVRRALGTHAPFSCDFRLEGCDGVERFIHMEGQVSTRATALLDRSLVVTLQDVTDLRRAEERVRVLAYHDATTGLPNAAYLRERIAQSMLEAHQDGDRIALVILDLEQFNRCNDSLGQQTCNLLLAQVGQRLQQAAIELQSRSSRNAGGRTPTVVRMGSDEFAVMLEMRDSGLDHLGDALTALHGALTTAFAIEGKELTLSATMGIATYPEDAHDADALIRRADAALHQGKQTSRGGHHFYSAQLQARAAHRLSLESDLRRAVQREQLQVWFQPRIALATLDVVGVEALLRWQHPERGLISPAEFIPVAEELGLIVDIGDWVLHQACRWATEWAMLGSALRVSVNVSAIQFQRADIVAQVASALRSQQMNARLLELEVTEGVLIERPNLVRTSLETLKSLGVGIALDDFGTGYSSLSYLRRLPIDYLKIDRSFVADLDVSADGGTIVSAIIALARGLKLSTVAEGVESLRQFDLLAERGCEEIQGFLFAKPMPATDIAGWLEHWLMQRDGGRLPAASRRHEERQLPDRPPQTAKRG